MDIIERFMTKGNQEVCRHLRALPAASSMSTRDLLEVGLRRRLEWVAPYLSTWPQVRLRCRPAPERGVRAHA